MAQEHTALDKGLAERIVTEWFGGFNRSDANRLVPRKCAHHD